MTTTEPHVQTRLVPQVPHRSRPWVAAALVSGPILWLAAELTTADDPALTLGILAVPCVAALTIALVVLCRRCTRFAWPAGILVGLSLVGLAVVHGMEFAQLALVRTGQSEAAIQEVYENTEALSGLVLLLMFFLGGLIGFLLLGVTLWRSPWVPKGVALLTLLLPVADLILGQHLVGLGAFVAAMGWLAVVVVRTGAPIPTTEGTLSAS